MAHRMFPHAVLLLALVSLTACSEDEPATSSPGQGAAGQGAAGQAAPAAVPQVNEGGTDALPPLPAELALPLVFVHGFAGSAQQFQSQAARLVANGYPAERLRAYEHDGAGFAIADYAVGLNSVIDEVRAKFGTEKVYLMGHSRGTAVSSMYLGVPDQAAKVAKYVALDGSGCANVPIPCIAPAQTTNTRAGQTDPIPGQKHVEVATSKESFALFYKFLFGNPPSVVEIVKQRAAVVISGRAVNFPANTGRDGTQLDVFAIDSATGMRASSTALGHFQIGAEGSWGPLTVDPGKHYEFVLSGADSATQQHFYPQPFLRSSEFVRLLSGPPDAESRKHTNVGTGHAALIVLRMREWTPADVLEVGTASRTGNQEPRGVISDATGDADISIYLHDDAASPHESSLALLPWFPEQPFQTGVDLYMPASDTPDGTITLKNLPRGDAARPQILRVPNWASTNHTVMVMFSDFAQD